MTKTLKKFSFTIFLAIFVITLIFCLPITSYAEDDDTISTNPFLTESYLEYYDLNSPIDVAYSNNAVAILENDESIVIYYDGLFTKYTNSDFDFIDANQIKFFNGNLIVLNDLSLYLFDFINGTFNQILDSDGKTVNCTFFDFNNEYLISSNKTTISIYRIETAEDGKPILTKQMLGINQETDKCISINANNEIFYIVGTTLKKFVIGGNQTEDYSFNYTPTEGCRSIIANTTTLYFSCLSGFGKLDLISGETSMLVDASPLTDTLDSLNTPEGLSFKGENILVTDGGLGSLQEFTPNGEFTGFAVTTTAKAYNRLNNVAPEISNYGNKVATFDSEKLLIITPTTAGNEYQNYYFNKELSTLGFTPTKLALGLNKVLLSSNTFAFFDLDTNTVLKLNDKDNLYSNLSPYSVTYSNGYFYALAGTIVLRIDEETLIPEQLFERNSMASTDKLAVDVDGYVYISESGVINKYDNTLNAEKLTSFDITENPIKITVDLNGNVYALYNGNKIEYYKDGVSVIKTLALNENLGTNKVVTSFTLDYASSNVYFLFGNDGLILSSNSCENSSITDVTIPEDFSFTSENGQAPNQMKIYKVNEGANKFEVTTKINKTTFDFDKITKSKGENYIYFGETENFTILLNDGEDGRCKLILVKTAFITEQSFDKDADISNGYAITQVHLYRFPLFSEDYAITSCQRLNKNTYLNIIGKVEFNNKFFYYATFTNGETTSSGYLPVEFVRENLIENFDRVTHKYKQISASSKKPINVYSNAEMSEVLDTFTSSEKVKTIKLTDDVSTVLYEKDGVLTVGYVYNKDFKNPTKNTVRNAIIIIIVTLSVTATSIYFIARKKENSI